MHDAHKPLDSRRRVDKYRSEQFESYIAVVVAVAVLVVEAVTTAAIHLVVNVRVPIADAAAEECEQL